MKPDRCPVCRLTDDCACVDEPQGGACEWQCCGQSATAVRDTKWGELLVCDAHLVAEIDPDRERGA